MSSIRKKEYLIIAISILLFGVLAALLFDLSIIKEGVVFSLYTIFGMLIPGCAATRLLQIRIKTNVEFITYALFLGYIISFFEYFLVVPFGIQKFGYIVSGVVTILSLIYLKKKDSNHPLEKDISGFWICFVISVVYIGIRFITTGGAGSIPVRLDAVNTDWDTFYWIGNTIELAHKFPPGDFRNLGAFYRYHYFSSLQLASTSVATGISPLVLSQFLYYLVSSSMLVFGGYCVFAKCSDRACLRGLAVFTFIFTSGMTKWTRNIYAEMLFVRPFSIDYGLGMFVFVILLIIDLFETEKYDNKLIIEIIAFSLLCGIKANFGSIAIVTVGLCSVYWISKKQYRWKAFAIGLSNLVCFILIYYFVTNISGYVGSVAIDTAENTFVVSDILNHGDTAKAYGILCKLPLPNVIVKAMFLFIYSFLSHPVAFGVAYYQIARAFIRKYKISILSWILFVSMMIASGIRVFVGIAGTSETYFIYAAFPLGIMFILINWKSQRNLTEKTYILKMSCFSVLMIISLVFNYSRRGKIYMVDRVTSGVKNIVGCGSVEINYEKPYVTKGQIEGYEWIRNNTNLEDVILVVSNNKTAYTAGVWSERHICAVREESLNEQIENVGSTFVAYVKDDTYINQILGTNDKVFANDEISIYKID